MTIHQYIERKQIRLNTTAVLTGGKWYRIVNGKTITDEEFNKIYPAPTLIGKKEKNPDSRKFYLEN